MTDSLQYRQEAREIKERFNDLVDVVRLYESDQSPAVWEREIERDSKMVRKFSTDKLKAAYNLFFVVDEYIYNRKIELEEFRHVAPPIDEMREIHLALSEFYEDFPRPEMIIEELKLRLEKLKAKEKK